MIDDRTRQLRVDGFRKAEASLRLEGMDPSGTPLYESVKARILSGEITYGEGRDEILAHYQKRGDRNCRGQDVSLEYRRHAKASWSGSARHPEKFRRVEISAC